MQIEDKERGAPNKKGGKKIGTYNIIVFLYQVKP